MAKKNTKEAPAKTAKKGGSTKAPLKAIVKANSEAAKTQTPNRNTENAPTRLITPQDYVDARRIITDVMDKHACTPWQISEMNRFLLKDSPVLIALAALLEESDKYGETIPDGKQSVKQIIEYFVRPENSFLHINSPCPPAFMQGTVMHIDGISMDLKQYAKDPDFWWQPITNPHARQLSEAIRIYKNACQEGRGADFMAIKNVIPGSFDTKVLNINS